LFDRTRPGRNSRNPVLAPATRSGRAARVLIIIVVVIILILILIYIKEVVLFDRTRPSQKSRKPVSAPRRGAVERRGTGAEFVKIEGPVFIHVERFQPAFRLKKNRREYWFQRFILNR